MKVSELREKLSELGLATTGSKSELESRLSDFSLNIGIAQMSAADGFSTAAENDPVSEDNDKDSFINSSKPMDEGSLGAFIDEFRQFKSEMLDFKAKFNFAAMSDAEGEINARGDTQAQLTAENTSLRSVNEVLKSEVRKLEEERNSLLLALRLLSASESKEIPLLVDNNQSKSQDKPDNSNSDCRRPQSRRNSGDNITQPEQPNKCGQQCHNRQNENSFTKKPVTVIVGDSMVKNVRGWELSNPIQKVIVKSFSGAITEDMEDYLKPVLRKEPENLILHVSTNDLKSIGPTELAKSIQSLAINIEENSPNTSVSISAILPRKESQISKNVTLVNNSLKLICSRQHWNFIKHKNIRLI